MIKTTMENTLFLQSDVKNPFEIYSRMLADTPIFWDEQNNLWAVYSYAACAYLLNHRAVEIPAQNALQNGKLNHHAATLVENLARIANPPRHSMLKEVAALVFEAMQPADTAELLDILIGNRRSEIDWVSDVCKNLPVLSLLRGFGFSDSDCEEITPQIEPLTKILLPIKTDEQIASINESIGRVYHAVAEHLESRNFLINSDTLKSLNEDEIRAALVSNLIGLLIQSYDAGRGLLSNSLRQLLLRKPNKKSDYIRRFVIETVRYDPPVHNTRRILVEDVAVGKSEMKKGQQILLVLAAANRDFQKFNRPTQFDIARTNNLESLTFGAGEHACLAKHFSINLTVNVLTYLLEIFPQIRLLENKVTYEPLINIRLPERMRLFLK